MFQLEQLKQRKENLEKELKEFVENAQRQIERYTGAIVVLSDIIADAEKDEEQKQE